MLNPNYYPYVDLHGMCTPLILGNPYTTCQYKCPSRVKYQRAHGGGHGGGHWGGHRGGHWGGHGGGHWGGHGGGHWGGHRGGHWGGGHGWGNTYAGGMGSVYGGLYGNNWPWYVPYEVVEEVQLVPYVNKIVTLNKDDDMLSV
jgi:hypothetical protein